MPPLVRPLLIPPDAPPAPTHGPVDVIVAAYNAADTIGACVDSLRAQRDTAVELIVVDDASTDATAPVAAAHGARVIRRPVRGGPAAARNEGARASRGALVFFAEADGWYPPDHLLTCRRALADPRVGAAIALGVRHWTERDGVVVQLDDALWTAAHALVAAGRRGTGAWLYRRDLFERLGGFDETLPRGEDVDLAARLAGLGWRTGAAGWSSLRHRNPDTWLAWWRQAARHGAGGAWPVAKLAVLAAIPILLIATPWAAVAGAIGWGGAIALTLWTPEQRLALRFLRRTGRWRALAAAPGLLWLRRLGLAWGAWRSAKGVESANLRRNR